VAIFAQKDAAHLVRSEVPASSLGHLYGAGVGYVEAFRTRANLIGLLQMQGIATATGRGVRINFKLVQPGQAAPPTFAPATFGPVRERVITSVSADFDTSLLDFESGEFRVPPEELRSQLKRKGSVDNSVSQPVPANGAVADWLAQSGADLMGGQFVSGALLVMLEGRVASDPIGKNFDTATPEEISIIYRMFRPLETTPGVWPVLESQQLRLWEPEWSTASCIWFHTREGNFGVMQVLGLTDNPRGIKIRYKLVQDSAIIPSVLPAYKPGEEVPLPPGYQRGQPVPLPPAYQRGQNPATGSAVSQAVDFKARISAADGISAFTKRDEVFAAIAKDAAKAGDLEDTRVALEKISAFTSRDEAIGVSARLFAAAGRRADALELARLVSAFTTRDALISELAK